MAGATPRDYKAVVRLNAEERADLERKRAARGQDVSTYFRTRLEEDDSVQG